MKNKRSFRFYSVINRFTSLEWRCIFVFLILVGACFSISEPISVNADDGTEPSGRTLTTKVVLTQYEWWMVYWSNNSVACDFFIEHEGDPTNEEIQKKCSYQLYNTWKNTANCDSKYSTSCRGLYLHQVSSIPIQKEDEVQLSPPSILLTLSKCEYLENQKYCTGNPYLTFTGVEPIPSESITRIYGSIGSQSFTCKKSPCSVSLPPTSMQGVKISFQGDSSYGDSTEKYTAYARVISIDAAENTFLVDVVSPQFSGNPPPSCSDIWYVFPNATEPPDWLGTPEEASDLNSSLKLYYLAAALINNGIVNASSCENGGLSDTNVANECGVTIAEPVILEWQNQFDDEILANAIADNVPATLVKNTFVRESQLWPGIYSEDEEVGLSQLTKNGADTVLLWNENFYQSYCPLILDESVCAKGFPHLSDENQAMLKNTLLQKNNATCPGCENGVDIDKANYSIHIFDETLKANCSQVNQLIGNITGKTPRGVSSYADLWRFTLVNYNAGPGCLGKAITRTWNENSSIDWQHVAANLDPACQAAADYVVDISNGNTEKIAVFSTPLPTSTKTPIHSPTPTKTFTATKTSTVTATLTATPLVAQTETPVITPTATETITPSAAVTDPPIETTPTPTAESSIEPAG